MGSPNLPSGDLRGHRLRYRKRAATHRCAPSNDLTGVHGKGKPGLIGERDPTPDRPYRSVEVRVELARDRLASEALNLCQPRALIDLCVWVSHEDRAQEPVLFVVCWGL